MSRCHLWETKVQTCRIRVAVQHRCGAVTLHEALSLRKASRTEVEGSYKFLKRVMGSVFGTCHSSDLLCPSVTSRPALGPTRPPIQWVTGGGRVPFPAVKRSGREADHSPPSGAEIKNAWRYTTTPPYVFMTWCLIKQR
jgi:hypothetical protein